MELSDIKIGDVVVTENHDIMVVTEIQTSRPKNPIVIQKNLNKQYICPPSHILQIIGQIDLDKMEESKSLKAERDDLINDITMPARLKAMNLEVGVSQIQVKHGGGTIVATYQGYKASRPKYPVSYITLRGGRYKCSEASVLAKLA
jgi:hypothetical protein